MTIGERKGKKNGWSTSTGGVEQLGAGHLAGAAGLGADSAVLVHLGVGGAFVAAGLAGLDAGQQLGPRGTAGPEPDRLVAVLTSHDANIARR